MTTGIQTYLNYIGGKWVPASTGEVEASINPANRHDVVGYVQLSGRDDLEKAVAAVIAEGKYVTYDLKPQRDDPTAVGTQEMAEAICRKLRGEE